MGRYGEMWGDVGRCGEMWGDVGDQAVKEEGLDEFEIEKRKIGDEVGRSRGGGVPHSQPTATRQR